MSAPDLQREWISFLGRTLPRSRSLDELQTGPVTAVTREALDGVTMMRPDAAAARFGVSSVVLRQFILGSDDPAQTARAAAGGTLHYVEVLGERLPNDRASSASLLVDQKFKFAQLFELLSRASNYQFSERLLFRFARRSDVELWRAHEAAPAKGALSRPADELRKFASDIAGGVPCEALVWRWHELSEAARRRVERASEAAGFRVYREEVIDPDGLGEAALSARYLSDYVPSTDLLSDDLALLSQLAHSLSNFPNGLQDCSDEDMLVQRYRAGVIWRNAPLRARLLVKSLGSLSPDAVRDVFCNDPAQLLAAVRLALDACRKPKRVEVQWAEMVLAAQYRFLKHYGDRPGEGKRGRRRKGFTKADPSGFGSPYALFLKKLDQIYELPAVGLSLCSALRMR